MYKRSDRVYDRDDPFEVEQVLCTVGAVNETFAF